MPGEPYALMPLHPTREPWFFVGSAYKQEARNCLCAKQKYHHTFTAKGKQGFFWFFKETPYLCQAERRFALFNLLANSNSSQETDQVMADLARASAKWTRPRVRVGTEARRL